MMIEIKKALPENGNEIAELASVIWHEHFLAIIGEAQVEYMLDKFQSEKVITKSISGGEYTYYMAYADGEFCGYMGICHNSKENSVFLSKIYVKKEFRKKGIASRLLKNVMDEYSDCNLFWLTVNRHNDIAVKAYENMGFTKEKTQVSDIGNGFVMDDYVMTIRK